MTALPPATVAVYRSLKRTAIVLLLMFRLDKPTGRDELASILDLSPETVSEHLSSLSQMGLITRTHFHNGYILTSGGRQLVLAQEDLPSMAQVLPTPQAQVLTQAQDHQPYETFRDQPAAQESDQESDSDSGNFPLLQESESVVNSLKNLTTDSDSDSSVAESEKSRLLAATRLLFSRTVYETGLEAALKTTSPQTILAWIAQAYDTRADLKFPPGLIFKSIQHHRQPRREYLDHPCDFLPADYLAAVGYTAALGGGEATPRPATPRPSAPSPAENLPSPSGEGQGGEVSDPSLDLPLGRYTPRSAWKAALNQLQLEMPKATFDTWLSDAYPVRWAEPGLFVIGAPTPFARDWLAGRLSSTITRLLTGILNRTVTVRFVAPENEPQP